MKADIAKGIPGWDNFVDFAGMENIFVTFVKTPKNADLVGKNMIEIGQIRGKDPFDASFDLLLEEELAVGLVDFTDWKSTSRPSSRIVSKILAPTAFSAPVRIRAYTVRSRAFSVVTCASAN